MSETGVLNYIRDDDYVEYFLFPKLEDVSEQVQESLLSNLLKKCEQIVDELTQNHLWHKDKFTLLPRTSITNKLIDVNANFPAHLHGVTHFGENIEDEWLIVFILMECTKRIPHLLVKVFDSDGEFLLIEAAEFLPPWMKPEVTENRVYLYDGKIHIIEPEAIEEDSERFNVNEAISIIRETSEKTEANSDIQTAIFKRLQDYPEKIKENLHTARIYVPIGVATILRSNPNLISAVVHAFCNRDSVDMKVCKAMKFFPPENRVYTNISFSKSLYAMLTHSKYVPDKRIGWNLPYANSKDYKSHILGVKIACGFEILISQAKQSSDLDSDKGWHKYLTALTKKQYFGDNIEHSRDYNYLMNKAKEFYINHRDSMYAFPLIGQKILDLTKTMDYNFEEFKALELNLPDEDDDAWMNISPEELDKYLQEKYGKKKVNSFNSKSNASDFTQKITTFLNHVSDMDGAEFPNMQSPVRPPRNNKVKLKNKVSFAENTKKDSHSQNKINFDPDSFSCAVQNILNFVIPEDDNWNLESDSEMSDYEDDNFIKSNSCQNTQSKMQAYMDEMDKELAATTIGDSFIKKNEDNFEDIESFTPVDVDMNALKNILESYTSQMGESGPSSNLLGSMGIDLDVHEEK